MTRLVLIILIKFIVFAGTGVHASDTNGISCTINPKCNPGFKSSGISLEKQICESFLSTCIRQLDGKPYEKDLAPHLINCEQSESCQKNSFKESINGCKSLLPKEWEKIKQNYDLIHQGIESYILGCAQKFQKVQNEGDLSLYQWGFLLNKSEFRSCVTRVFPNLNEAISGVKSNWEKFKNWTSLTEQKVNISIESDCGKIDKLSPDYNQCRINAGLNALLESLEEPYKKWGFQETTDFYTENFINRFIESKAQKNCYNARGSGIEFCLILAGSIKGLTEVASEIPTPIGLGSKTLKKGIAKLTTDNAQTVVSADAKLKINKTIKKQTLPLLKKELEVGHQDGMKFSIPRTAYNKVKNKVRSLKNDELIDQINHSLNEELSSGKGLTGIRSEKNMNTQSFIDDLSKVKSKEDYSKEMNDDPNLPANVKSIMINAYQPVSEQKLANYLGNSFNGLSLNEKSFEVMSSPIRPSFRSEQFFLYRELIQRLAENPQSVLKELGLSYPADDSVFKQSLERLKKTYLKD